MAIDSAVKNWRKHDMAAKLETTTGTFISVSATDATPQFFNVKYRSQVDIEEREANGTLSKIRSAIGMMRAGMTFEHEIYGAGSASAPAWYDYMQCCGFALNTLTLTPTAPTKTLSLAAYFDGLVKRVSGSMGGWTLTLEAGKPARMAYEFLGKFERHADATMLVPTKISTIAPRYAGVFTIGGTTYITDRIVITCRNDLQPVEDVTATNAAGDATGCRNYTIMDREIMLETSPQSVAIASKDWTTEFAGSTTNAVSIRIGSTGSNLGFTISLPNCELQSPDDGDQRGGKLVSPLRLKAMKNSDAGDDEISIAQV